MKRRVNVALVLVLVGLAFMPRAWAQQTVRYLSVWLGTGGSAAGSLVFYNATNANTATVQSGVTSATYTTLLPTTKGTSGQFMQTDGGTPAQLSWQTPVNQTSALLSATHTDTTASAVTRGALIAGQGVTPTWAQLVVGVANRVLRSDGTDISWAQANLLTDVTGTFSSGGIPYFSSASAIASSAALAANQCVFGGGAGLSPATDSDCSILVDTITLTKLRTGSNTLGLGLLDTGGNNYLQLVYNEDASADRTLNVLLGDAARTITLSGNPTLADWFDQAVKVASSPTFVGGTFTGGVAVGSALSGSTDAFTVTNNISTGIIANFKDGPTSVFMIADGGGITATGQYSGPNGNSGAPAYSFSAAGNTGMFRYAGGELGLGVANTNSFAIKTTGIDLQVRSDGSWGFSSTTDASGSGDVFLTRSAAAVLQLGARDAASPTSQTIRAQGSRGGIDTNVAGANLTLLASTGTGIAATSEIIFQAPIIVGSGTGAQTPTTQGKVTAGGIQNTRGDSFVTGDVTNATTTFANVTGLSATLVSGRRYSWRMVLFVSESTAADGAKLDFNGGSATITNFRATCVLTNAVGATLTQTAATSAALATVINIGAFTDTNVHKYTCEGSIEPSAAGTFIPRQAQNSHSTGTLTTLRGGYLSVWDQP